MMIDKPMASLFMWNLRCVTFDLFLLPLVCLCYLWVVCVTFGLFVLPLVCLCYLWFVCVTFALFVLDFYAFSKVI